MIDAIDQQILDILQRAARTNNADIARQVGMAPSAVLERIRKLEKRQIIRGYSAHLDPHVANLPLLAFVFVRTDESLSEMGTAVELAKIPEVLEVHHVAGEDCYLIKVRASEPESLGKLLRERLGHIPTVLSTRSTIVLETVKEDTKLPLAGALTGDDTDD